LVFFPHIGQYAGKLSDAHIDGTLLKELDDAILVEEFGFKRFEALKLMRFARHGMSKEELTGFTILMSIGTPMSGDLILGAGGFPIATISSLFCVDGSSIEKSFLY
jgi:hypothetical protein